MGLELRMHATAGIINFTITHTIGVGEVGVGPIFSCMAVRFTQGATVGKTPVYCMKMAKCAQYSTVYSSTTVQYSSTARTMHV